MAAPPSKPRARSSPVLQDPRARDEAERRDRHRNDELAQACGELEEDLEQLRTRYELYFVGVERREPARDREEMRRRVARLKGEVTRNAGLRFRIETVHARFLSYDRMWTRTARQKEDGTYRRDLLRARRHKQGSVSPETPRSVTAEAQSPARPEPVEGRTGAQPQPAATTAPTAPAPASVDGPKLPPGISAERLRALYAEYVDAKRRCNESTARVTYDALAKTVARQVPELIAKFGARSVEFKVVIKDGHAVLKAIPQR